MNFRRTPLLAIPLVLGLSALPVRAAGPEADLSSTVKRFESLKVGLGSVPVKDIVLESGHAVCTLKGGAVTPVRAGDEVIGLFFEGTGTFEYRSVDPVEHPVMAYEARKATSLAVEKSGDALVVRDTFTRLLWISAGRKLPDLPGGAEMWNAARGREEAAVSAGSSLQASFQANRERSSYVQEAPIAYDFAAQLANGAREPLVVVEIEGGKENLRHVFDASREHSESLVAMRRDPDADSERKLSVYPIVISDQPIGRDRRDPLTAEFLLTDVRVEVAASDGKDVTMTVAETIVPQRLLGVARFSLLSRSTAYSATGYPSVRSHHVKSVTDDAGKPLSFHHSYGSIVVGLASAAPPGVSVKLRFEIDGDFLIRPGGDSYWLLGTRPWFPQPDLGGQFYTFHARVKAKKPFLPFASGRTVSRGVEGDSNVVETDIDKPVQFAIVMAGKYEFEEETRDGVTIRVASYAIKNSRAMKQLTNLAFGIIEFYQRFLGPFPFPELDIVEINSYGFGQAPPGVMFITKEAFNPFIGEENQYFSQGINERFAHEIAHQYWGQVVKMPSDEEQWLTESFAEYSAAIFLRELKGKSTYERLLAHWKTAGSRSSAISPIPLVNRLNVPGEEAEAFRARTDLLYDKGSWLLATIHKEVGDDTFLTFLKSYQKTFRWKFGTTKQVAGLLQVLTKKDWMPFFEKNYWGTGMP